MKKLHTCLGVACIMVAPSTPSAWSMKVCPLIKQQGRRLDRAGNPAAGTRTFIIGIYDQPTAGSK